MSDAGLKGGDPPAEILRGGMAVMIGDILPKPTSEGLDRHEVGAVGRPRSALDPQVGRRLTHAAGAIVADAVPQHDQRALGSDVQEPEDGHDVVTKET